MTPSLIKRVALLALASVASQAAVVTYNWNITYLNANPDGLSQRRVIGVNGAFPLPAINVTMGDTLVLNVVNQLDVATAIHAHGLFHTGSVQMDGAAMVTQCPIPPGANFTYTIPITQHGTYWIHAHHKGQYVDGLRAPLIIRNNVTERYQYDDDYTVSLSDWYHKEHDVLLKEYLSPSNTMGMEPVPNSALVNHQAEAKFNFAPGKTYRLRIINMSALATFQVHIDGHDMDIIEVDGIDVQRSTVKTFPIAAGQRYSVLVKAKNDTSSNFALHGATILAHPSTPGGGHGGGGNGGGGGSGGGGGESPHQGHMVSTETPNMNGPFRNATATIVYSATAPLAPAESPARPEFNDGLLVPLDPMASAPPDQTFTLTTEMQVFDDGIFRPTFNNITYVKPKVPSLYTALSMGNLSSNAVVYGKHTLPMIIKHNTWTEVILNNNDAADHPFHLHGHAFHIVGRSKGGIHNPNTPFPYYNLTNPLRRDTVMVPAMTSLAIRFPADNPGVWFFHCHMEWHAEAGLAATFIEAPEVFTVSGKPDPSHIQQCVAQGIPYQGNAAGNQGLDLSGENTGPNVRVSHTGAAGSIHQNHVGIAWSAAAVLLGLAML
ncbi:ferroxidase fet3 [Actinomortierella ambigua]|nr:ferroxidase fet3 [Actinomortierella ambigua]